MKWVSIICLTLSVFAFQAEAGQRPSVAQGASHWRGVGKLHVEGKGYCTVTLISSTQALTAAHCVFDTRRHTQIPARRMRVVIGAGGGDPIVSRTVRRVAVPEGHNYNPRANLASISSDVALLELSAPVASHESPSFDVGGSMSGALTMVAYDRSRSRTPTINPACRAGTGRGSIRAMSCLIGHGGSGAPIFEMRGGRPRIVAIVSASGRAGSKPATLAVEVGPLLERLRARLVSAN